MNAKEFKIFQEATHFVFSIEKIKKMREFITDNNLSDKKTFKSINLPKDKNGFINFNKIEL